MRLLSTSLKFAGIAALTATQGAQAQDVPTVFDSYVINNTAERTLSFDPTGTGAQLPACWGIDTAWNSNDNAVRAMRAMTPDVVDVVRVSFNPYALVATPGVVPSGECANQLKSRMEKVQKVEALRTGNKKVDIAINLDAARADLQKDYYYINSDGSYDLDQGTKNHEQWAKLLHAYVKTIESQYGNPVVSVAPFNEPDYYWNGLRQPHFKAINQAFRKNYPDMQHVRISGGNTLNCSEALNWYNYLKDELDEGNTHQLAGDPDAFVNFYETLRNDGKYSTGDELHNVMEAMMGVHYGMQTGIWWGEAARVRGQFCQANKYGMEMAYAENRWAWSAASVYKWDDKELGRTKVQAFLGHSERQGRPASYSFVSKTKDVYVDGVGPTREFVLEVPGDANNGYQTAAQRNAEAVYDITWGEDVQPEINGTYIIVTNNGKIVAREYVKDQKDEEVKAGVLTLLSYKSTDPFTYFDIKKVRIDNGGDFSYYNIFIHDDSDNGWYLPGWNLNEEVDLIDFNKNALISFGPIHSSTGTGTETQKTDFYSGNSLWYFEYAGDGWFRIRNMVSNFCLRPLKKNGNGSLQNQLVLAPFDASDNSQLFKLIPLDEAPKRYDKKTPAAPANLQVVLNNGSVKLSWNKVADADLSHYVLLRSENGGEFNTIARNLTGTEIIDNTVRYGVEYTYKVVAFDQSLNRSADSNTATASIRSLASLWCALPFENDLTDASGNSFSARTNAASLTYITGHKGQAWQPKTNQTVMLPTGASPMQRRFSVCAWVKTSNGTRNGQYLFDFGTDENNHVGLAVNKAGKMLLHAANPNGSASLEATAPAANQWSHVAVVLDFDTWTIYVDGEAKATLEQPGVHGCVPSDEKVLNYVGRAIRQFDFVGAQNNEGKTQKGLLGGIDEFHVYSYPLTAEQVKLDMNGETLGVEDIVANGDAQVVSREYFNLKGQLIAYPAEGETVVVRTGYADGTVRTSKEVFRAH